MMLNDLLAASRTVDPAVLGPRVRAARLRAGLTQAEAAGTEMSTAYVSRIEAGQRRPDPALEGASLLEVMLRNGVPGIAQARAHLLARVRR